MPCIDIWAIMLENFGEPGQEASATDARYNGPPPCCSTSLTIHDRFGPAMEALALQIIRLSSFSENFSFLQSLDSTTRSEDVRLLFHLIWQWESALFDNAVDIGGNRTGCFSSQM